MSHPETKFSHWVMSKFLNVADAQRIENTAGSGTPDINVCYQGLEFWIETKLVTNGGRVHIRPYQYSWIRRRTDAGGRIFIFAYESERDEIWVFRGRGLRAEMIGGTLTIISPVMLIQWKGAFPSLDVFLNYDKKYI